MTQLARIREKLDLIGEKYLPKATLDKLIAKFAPSYTVAQLCDTKMITPLKRWVWYINNINRTMEDPYRIASIYFGDELYMFGGLGVYQMYGYSTQLIEWYTVYNTQISWERIIGKTRYIFRKQRESFFYGMTTAASGDITYAVMSRERALIQMMREGKIFRTFPARVDKDTLINMAEQYAPKSILTMIQKLCI